jgi:digeranylgeranylglycerophospholipid reductase
MAFDLVVVGASFAGLACARAAALAGAKVLVIEKKSSAGEKLHTTGILVKDAVEANPWLQDLPSQWVQRIDGVRLYAPNLHYVDLNAPGYYFWATDTTALLDWMAQTVQSLGVQIRYEALFENAQLQHGRWQVHIKNHEPVQASYIVGADGPHSRVAKALGLSHNTQFLYGLEHEYLQAKLQPGRLHCFVSRALAPGYIGWAVPGAGMTQIGVARRVRAGQDALRLEPSLAHMRAHVQPVGEPAAVRAGMIPCGGVLPKVARERAMLVGDAAGMVSPVTAGGIHTALKHGHAVGEAVAAFVKNKATDPADFLPAQYPRFLLKRGLRWCFDNFQSDGVFNLLLTTHAMRRVAQQLYFHRKGRSVLPNRKDG